jgi:putative acetyltransferase
MNIKIRPYEDRDAQAVLEIHRDAVHNTAAPDYEQEILDEWSQPIDEKRLRRFREENSADVRIVAEINGTIVGFGELVTSENILGACYVSSSAGGKGVGKSIMFELEKIASEKGLKYLSMDSSVTAAPFYRSCGYSELERGEHTLKSGRKMACVKMHKNL